MLSSLVSINLGQLAFYGGKEGATEAAAGLGAALAKPAK
jgi:hypothetical protein